MIDAARSAGTARFVARLRRLQEDCGESEDLAENVRDLVRPSCAPAQRPRAPTPARFPAYTPYSALDAFAFTHLDFDGPSGDDSDSEPEDPHLRSSQDLERLDC